MTADSENIRKGWFGLPRRRPKLLFLHIPKTAGSSVSRGIERAYRLSRYHICSAPTWRATGYLTTAEPGSLAFEEQLHALRSHLLLNAAEEGTRFLTGHVWYTAALKRLRQEKGFITAACLRDPVDRMISHYLYNRFNTRDHTHTTDDIETFLETPRAREMATLYIKYLGGHAPDGDYHGEAARGRARAALDDIDELGVLDALPDFMDRVGARIGARLKSGHRRKSPAMGREEYAIRHSEELRQRITALCAPDLELYEYARNSH